MEHEKLTYPEALRYLAKKYNIEIEELYDRNLEEEKKNETERESLYVVCTYAQKFFSESLLNTNEGKSIGLSYFKERGLSDEIIQRFQLGYAPDKRTAFTDAAIKDGYNLDYLVKAGLTIKPETEQGQENTGWGSNPFDRYSARVIFPIHSITGRVIGFGGRALKKEAKAKYINSPETEIYHKSNILYGMPFARKTISNEDNCYLVEGYMDVTSLHQAGIENVVASSGTSLTVEQVRLIKRYTNNITIMYDGDPAGIKASFRGIDLILEEGLNVRAILFPEGEDPDSYSRKHSESELKDFIKAHTTDFIRFKTQLLYSDSDNDPIKRATLIQQIVESIALIPNSITRTVFIQECSKIMKMDEQSLLTELNKALTKRYAKRTNQPNIEEVVDLDNPPVPQPVDSDFDSPEHNEKKIIQLMLSYGSHELEIQTENQEQDGQTVLETHKTTTAQYIYEHLSTDDIKFENRLYQKIFDQFVEMIQAGEKPSIEPFIHHQDPEISNIAIDLTTFPYTIADWEKKHGIPIPKEEDNLKVNVESAIYSLKIKHIMKIIAETQKEIEHATSDEDMLTLIAKKRMLDQAKNAFSKELGWVITR